ncbi:protein of unknown function [Azospirillum baldaniorum]|uniref:Uncharacterized protein n=1 Tax=Azospirillum baldaniorum TaxID=1064539 RepID=A0A9P1JP98_9PROT|nr:protein of unknown function [Azospirillum baldaniorum]
MGASRYHEYQSTRHCTLQVFF